MADGGDAVVATLKGSFTDALPAIILGTKAGLEAAGSEIMAVSEVLCPKDTSTLVNSRFEEPARQEGDVIRVVIGYGRGDAVNPKDGKHPSQYAVPVHEILEARHEPPTQAKYLEVPAVGYEPEFGETLKVWISRYVKGEEGLVGSAERIR